MKHIKGIAISAVLLSLLLALTASAQTSDSRITGTVTDSTGAVVPGAKVTARNEATGVTYTQTTTGAGLYAFPSVPVGVYTINVEMAGFKTVNKTGNVLEVGTPLVVDASLEVGQTSEVVNIEGGYERIQTANATLGNVVEQKTIESLPLNGRNPLSLIVLEPGVTQRSAGGAGSGVHVNGSRDRAYNVTIDGIDANESSVPNPVSNIYRLNPDNVQEYKVVTNNATASEGRNSGAAISVATRRGTNNYHGTVQEFMRNTALNSNNWFSNAQGTPKPEIKMHQYGFEFGGPIRKNKTHFFGSWQGQNIKFTQPIDQSFGIPSIYTPSARAGVYRYFVADPRTPFVLNGLTITRNVPQLVDAKTGALAPGVRNCTSATDTNCVASFNFAANDPQRRGVDPTIGKLFGAYPQPNSYAFGDGLNTATYLWNPPTHIAGPQYKVRVDHKISENQEVYARWLHADYDTLGGDPLNGRPQVFPGFPPRGEVHRRSKNLALNHRWLIANKYVNSFTAGFSRFRFLFTQGEANPDFPNIPGYTFNNASYALINTPRTERAVTTPQFVDDFSFAKGSHQFAFGLNFRFYQHNDRRGQPGGVNVTPTISFASGVRPPSGFNTPTLGSSTAAGINATDNTRLLGTINDIMGIPARLSQVFLGDINSDAYLPFIKDGKVTLYAVGNRLRQYNFYGQDEWRVRQNLSISYGVRFEFNPAPTEVNGKVYVPDKPIETVGGVTFVKADTFFERNNLGIGPRVGIAWSPRNSTKFVVRAGYGLAFDALPSFQVTAVSGRPPGLIGSCVSTLGGATTAGCTVAPDLRIGQGFPLVMGAPTFKPSSQLTLPLVTLTNAPPVSVFDPDLKLPTVHQWNLSLQRELPLGIVGQIAYVGRRGTRLQRAYDANQIDATGLLNSFTLMQQNVTRGCNPDGSGCPAGVTGSAIPLVTSGIVNAAFVNSATTRTDLSLNGAGNFVGRVEQQTIAGRFRINQQFGTVTYIDAGGSSHYHALQATLRKRFEKGLLFGASYSFQKSIDDQSVDPVGAASGGGLSTTNSRTPTDARRFDNEKARSDFDRTHVFTAFSVYELPFGKGKSLASGLPSALTHVIGGWAINGIVTVMSGEPFSVRSGIRTSNFSHESRADIIGGVEPPLKLQDIPGVVGPVVFANANGFAIPAPGQNGAGRNIFIAPSYWNVDLGIQKNFALTERFRLQFRTEMFNAFNHANFDNPRDASSGSPSFRSTLFGQTCCAAVAPPSTQTVIQTGEAARVIQLALKLMF
jgi:hypothetical protein